MIKKVKLILVIIIFILSFICHFAYELIPNFIFSIIFPVNESIWEHMKLIATPVIIGSIFEYIYYKRKKINCNNFILSYGISIIFGIGFYLAIYMPIHICFGHNLYVAIILLFITYIIMEVISYYIINLKEIRYSNIIGILLIIFIYGIFYYFTYYPKENILFFNSQKDNYR